MKLHNLKLRGSIALNSGLGLDEIEVDFDSLPDGLIGVIGPNTVGKTSLIDNMHPFRQLFFRGGSLPKHFLFEDSYRILEFSVGSTKYKSEIKINSKLEDVSATLFKEDSGDFTPINDGKLTTYDIELENIGLYKSIFQNFVMRSANRKKLASMSTSERKNFFLPLINTKLYEKMVKFLKADSEKYNGILKNTIYEITSLEKYIQKIKDNNANIKQINELECRDTAKKYVDYYESYVSYITPKIKESEDAIKVIEAERDKIREKLNKIHSSSLKNNPELQKELLCEDGTCPALQLFNRLKTVKLDEPIEITEKKLKDLDGEISEKHKEFSSDVDFLKDSRFKTLKDKVIKKFNDFEINHIEISNTSEIRKELNLLYGKVQDFLTERPKEVQSFDKEQNELEIQLHKKADIEKKIEKITVLMSLFGNDGLPLDDLVLLGESLSSIGTDIMKNVYGDSASINFTTIKKKSSGKGMTDCFDVLVTTPTNSGLRDISTLSSSETTWIEEAILEACFSVYNNNFGNIYKTAFLDEQEGAFSESSLLDFLNVKQLAHDINERSHTFLISQRPDIFREVATGAIVLQPGSQPKIEIF